MGVAHVTASSESVERERELEVHVRRRRFGSDRSLPVHTRKGDDRERGKITSGPEHHVRISSAMLEW